MIADLLHGILETKPNFILAAAGVCGVMAMMLTLLIKHSEFANTKERRYGAFWIAIVAGVGVWTTHFVAMIGYRPDAGLSYDLQTTLASVAVGILFVGIPMAASEFTRDDRKLMALGVATSLGVAAMHMTGMTAIENCLTNYNLPLLAMAVATSAICFAFAFRQSPSQPVGLLKRAAGVVGGVCSLHFIAMSSVSLTKLNTLNLGIGGQKFSIFVVCLSLGVFAIAIIGTFNHRRALTARQLNL